LSYISDVYSDKFVKIKNTPSSLIRIPAEISEDSINVNIKIKDLLEKSKYFSQFSTYSDIFSGYDRAATRVRIKRLHNRELRRWYSKYGRARQL
jgi:hypothetical protein